jgi:hypothetical protein
MFNGGGWERRKAKSGGGQDAPSARAGHILVTARSRREVYVVGGYNENGPLADVWKYDVPEKHWSAVREAPAQTRGKIKGKTSRP